MVEVARVAAGPKVREWARKHGFDEWMVARWIRLTDDPARLLAALQKRPPAYLRVNPLRADTAEIIKRLSARGFAVERTRFDPQVLHVRDAPTSIGALQEHLLGMTTPQDLASASAGLAMEAGSAETIIDMAAAPGIKTLHLAGDMENQGALLAVEPAPERMRALRFMLERCGVANAALRLGRGEDVPGEAWADKVLLDAPCTGEGTIPKDRSRRRGKPAEIAHACEVQSSIVDAADKLLRPGGVFVYATCTFSPEENEGQVQRLLDRGYAMERLPFDECEGAKLVPGRTDWPGLRLSDDMALARRFLPGLHPTLGFFVARLRKPGGA